MQIAIIIMTADIGTMDLLQFGSIPTSWWPTYLKIAIATINQINQFCLKQTWLRMQQAWSLQFKTTLSGKSAKNGGGIFHFRGGERSECVGLDAQARATPTTSDVSVSCFRFAFSGAACSRRLLSQHTPMQATWNIVVVRTLCWRQSLGLELVL